MNWLNFFEHSTQHRHPFGRGINSNLHPEEEELFNKSYEAFEKKDIINAYKYFFESLENFTNDISNENIITKIEDDKLEFEIYQGSARIIGTITNEKLYAEVIMVKSDKANVALKRKILERNYQFTYASYFTDEEYIKLKLFHDNITMSPQKIFFPLRELALNADFDKEYIRHEFPDMELEDIAHLKELSEDEIKIKYDFLKEWIEELDKKVKTLPSNDNTGMQSFIYLTALFKIDYLLVPKYNIYQNITKKVQEYFGEQNTTPESRNDELKQYLEVLQETSIEEFSKNFYNARYTFNPTERASNEEINNFINESLIKIRWYKNNRYRQIIPTIYRYIAFYILYNYGIHPVIKELLHTLIAIQYPKFFKALGYATLYDEEDKSFSKRAIISKIEDAIAPYQNQFKLLQPFGNKLNFNSMNEFNNSFYLQLQNLNFEEI
ncbi:hypothetical protein [Candidatus Sulfurimonas baltica]|uniref:Uncharacterized protein n=1 Tax=Candidatus Sulfurimonas baltica TaxID=2740404 RepID=A0A7S7LTX2_9BACT|nr:hypothetical protein [Candidatus Sulfurimonas baltica]QOY51247.1 hypothetical protein HUE88_08900 [Candidatus Sulfurimonas baltica]